jgi:hypothetical protein
MLINSSVSLIGHVLREMCFVQGPGFPKGPCVRHYVKVAPSFVPLAPHQYQASSLQLIFYLIFINFDSSTSVGMSHGLSKYKSPNN